MMGVEWVDKNYMITYQNWKDFLIRSKEALGTLVFFGKGASLKNM